MGKKLRKNIPFGLSLSRELKNSIDIERGDISRSKYIQKIIERNFQNFEVTNEKGVLDNKNSIRVDSSSEARNQHVSPC